MKKDQNTCARRASTFGPEEHNMFPLTLPGTGGSRVQGTNFILLHEVFHWKTPKVKCCGIYAVMFHSGMDAAALKAVEGIASAGNAKGVFYDN